MSVNHKSIQPALVRMPIRTSKIDIGICIGSICITADKFLHVNADLILLTSTVAITDMHNGRRIFDLSQKTGSIFSTVIT